MAFKQLGAINITTALTETTLYTVPSSKETICNALLILNRGSNVANVRLSHVPSGQSVGNAYYLAYYDTIDSSGGKILYQLPICMAVGDKLSIYSDQLNVNAIAWGDEISTT